MAEADRVLGSIGKIDDFVRARVDSPEVSAINSDVYRRGEMEFDNVGASGKSVFMPSVGERVPHRAREPELRQDGNNAWVW